MPPGLASVICNASTSLRVPGIENRRLYMRISEIQRQMAMREWWILEIAWPRAGLEAVGYAAAAFG